MLASLMRNVKERSGDGRVRHQDTGDATGRADAVGKAGRSVGEGAQALAWGGVNFTKSPPGSTSVSTSPETDPGDFDLFPFFTGDEKMP